MVEHFDLAELSETVTKYGNVVRIVIAGFQGSAPRETGASMLVWAGGQSGTIGGGALEWQAAKAARKMLELTGDWRRETLKMPLGPALNQCCGGSVDLLLERYTSFEIASINATAPSFTRPKAGGLSPTPAPLQASRLLRAQRSGAGIDAGWFSEALKTDQTPLYLYGAGHVGREIVRVLAGLPYETTWIDTHKNRFPEPIPVAWQANTNPAALVKNAPDNALHFVLTY
ncbi:MAG: xanthine dehydrogenase accessory protein XdhC, partial [Rhodobacteraceae bacterium]|nr:xanthine dehydrogenase accessory protein XdhC [Paracoccaceae bacterium]